MRVGREMPQPRAARVVVGDVAGPHRQQRPAQARIADAAAVRVLVVGRGGVFRVLVSVPRIGAPPGLARLKALRRVAAPVVAIDLVGEGRGQKHDRRRCRAFRRQDVDRHDVLRLAAAQPHAVNAGRHSLGDVHGEIGVPAAIVEIVLVEMDRGVVARRMAPVGLHAGPPRPAHRPRRQVAQRAVQPVRAAVDYPVARNLRAEIPPCHAFRRLRLGLPSHREGSRGPRCGR